MRVVWCVGLGDVTLTCCKPSLCPALLCPPSAPPPPPLLTALQDMIPIQHIEGIVIRETLLPLICTYPPPAHLMPPPCISPVPSSPTPPPPPTLNILPGKLNREILLPLICTYLASIPATNIPPPRLPVEVTPLAVTYPEAPVVEDVQV